ncbi:MAG: YicC/YloC family endoribonuclease [Planctomycetota bacterium]
MRSMTGHGQARWKEGPDAVEVQLRSVNHRFFNLRLRGPEAFASLEAGLQEVLRRWVTRGSVEMELRVEEAVRPESVQVDVDLAAAYERRFGEIAARSGRSDRLSLDALSALPGVVATRSDDASRAERAWPVLQKLVDEAGRDLVAAREREGERLRLALTAQLEKIRGLVAQVAKLTPDVVEAHKKRLTERIRVLVPSSVPVSADDLAREVALFADRCDISEEIQRIGSHIDEFLRITGEGADVGRRLDFLTQEMLREANTIGSKANDARIAHRVVEVKTEIEKVREQVQNIE